VIEFVRHLAVGVVAVTASVSVSVHQANVISNPMQPQRDGPRAARTDFIGPHDITKAELAAALAEQQAIAADASAKRSRPAPVRSAAPVAAPKPAPAPAPAPGPCDSTCVQNLIRQAFAPYGQAGIDWGLRVAACESGYNANAYNPAGPYYGVFQFLMSTFKATPYGNQNIFDASANVNAAAWKYGQGGAGAWGCS
jgi:Transglycosylase SLT domain